MLPGSVPLKNSESSDSHWFCTIHRGPKTPTAELSSTPGPDGHVCRRRGRFLIVVISKIMPLRIQRCEHVAGSLQAHQGHQWICPMSSLRLRTCCWRYVWKCTLWRCSSDEGRLNTVSSQKINPSFTLQYEMCPTPADANDATIYPSLIDTLFIIWWIYTVSRNAIPKEEWIVGVQLLAGFFSKKKILLNKYRDELATQLSQENKRYANAK